MVSYFLYTSTVCRSRIASQMETKEHCEKLVKAYINYVSTFVGVVTQWCNWTGICHPRQTFPQSQLILWYHNFRMNDSLINNHRFSPRVSGVHSHNVINYMQLFVNRVHKR